MPTPKTGESKEDYIGRCIPILVKEGKKQDQAVAICYSMWKQKNENKLIEKYLGEKRPASPTTMIKADTFEKQDDNRKNLFYKEMERVAKEHEEEKEINLGRKRRKNNELNRKIFR